MSNILMPLCFVNQLTIKGPSMGTVGWQKYSGINVSETEITDNISVICTCKTYIHGN